LRALQGVWIGTNSWNVVNYPQWVERPVPSCRL